VQPAELVSKPGLPTRLTGGGFAWTAAVADDDNPAVSATVTFTVYVPADEYVCCALELVCGPTTAEPSPKSNVDVATGVASVSVEVVALHVARPGGVQPAGLVSRRGLRARLTGGGFAWTAAVAEDDSPAVSATVTFTVYVPADEYVCCALELVCGPTTAE